MLKSVNCSLGRGGVPCAPLYECHIFALIFETTPAHYGVEKCKDKLCVHSCRCTGHILSVKTMAGFPPVFLLGETGSMLELTLYVFIVLVCFFFPPEMSAWRSVKLMCLPSWSHSTTVDRAVLPLQTSAASVFSFAVDVFCICLI